MLATFLVEVDIPDPSPTSLAAEVDAIEHALELGGIEFTSVKPWARPTTLNALPPNQPLPNGLPPNGISQ